MASLKKFNGTTWVDSKVRKLTTATDIITTLPADVYADGTNATVGLVGNMQQSGTPTPSSPIQPTETGDKTANLWDEDYTGISQTIIYKPIYVGNGDFTLSTTTPYDSNVANVFLLSGNVSTGASSVGNGAWLNRKVTTVSENGYITIAYRQYSGTTNPANCQTMLNSGSTALPYQPYGYKLDIKSANTTTPIYLGEVQTTRKIKKLVFDGTENWNEGTSNYYIFIDVSGRGEGIPNSTALSTHTESGVVVNNNGTALFFKKSVFVHSSLADFKSYLAQQYAAGTPVCVWYVLAEPTTGIVNEPLRKIGDYADTVSGITIPTIAGKDTFDVDTTLKPSEVELTYTGWHDATVKEWDGSQWQ